MIAYTVLVSFGMRTVSFLERLFSPGIGSYAANLTEVKTRMPNAKVLSEKQAIVASLTEKLQGAAAGIIVDYKGITVAEDTALRAECRKNEVDYAVVKNTLLRFAFNNVGLNELDEQLNGTTALAVASDPVAPARVIADYAKKLNGKFEIKGGFMDGTFFLADVNTDVDAVNGVMSSLFQLSAYLLLMPLLVILASNLLFEELDNDTLKNLVTVPVNRTKLVLSKMLVLLLFAVGFMAVGGLVNLAVLLFQGWKPVGFWTLFGVGIEEGLIMWVGALPCILLVVLLNKNYIVSVVITFFYTIANYILSMNDMFLTQPFGLNIGTLFPGPLAFRWTFQFYDQSQTSAELADLLERVSPYFLNGVQVFGVIIVEAIVFLALIAFVYRRQEI